jgi:hypothetical protein
MTDNLGVRVATAANPRSGDGTWGKTYRYLRTAMVGLLLALGVSVLYQTSQQDFHLLTSVSAYYYTPAQPIFVGSLIGLAACMISLRGTTELEEIFLNLGGMFAAVVAIVPSSRGKDYLSAVRNCNRHDVPVMTDRASGRLDCPTVQTLTDATRDNIENNMVTLLVLGLLGLIATVWFFFRRNRAVRTRVALFWLGFGTAAVVYVAGAVGYFAYTDWFIRYGHYVAGIGLLVCLFVVAVANARRRGREQSEAVESGDRRTPVRRGYYVVIAGVTAAVTLILTPLMLWGTVSLLWLEITVGALFIAFWTVQTIEQGDTEPAP